MEARRIELLSKYHVSDESTSIVYLFRVSRNLADKQASVLASLIISLYIHRRRMYTYPTSFETSD